MFIDVKSTHHSQDGFVNYVLPLGEVLLLFVLRASLLIRLLLPIIRWVLRLRSYARIIFKIRSLILYSNWIFFILLFFRNFKSKSWLYLNRSDPDVWRKGRVLVWAKELTSRVLPSNQLVFLVASGVLKHSGLVRSRVLLKCSLGGMTPEPQKMF